MNFSMTGQGDCLIEVTAWAGLTVFSFLSRIIPDIAAPQILLSCSCLSCRTV